MTFQQAPAIAPRLDSLRADDGGSPHAAVRALGYCGAAAFLGLAIYLLAQWRELVPHLSAEWDPFWLTTYAAASLAVAALVPWARGKALLAVAVAAIVALAAAPIVSGAAGWAMLKLAAITLAAAGLGLRGLKWIVPNARIGAGARMLLAIVLGYGAIGLLMLAVGLLHLWRPAVVATALAIAGLASFRDIIELLREWRTETRGFWSTGRGSGDLRLASFCLSAICICGFGSYLFSLAPATHWDVLHYHLGIPRIYAERGALVDLDHTWAVHCVRNGEMLYLLGLLIHGLPLPLLINFQFGLLAAGLVAGLGALVGNRQTGWLAGSIFFAIPLVSYTVAQGLIDLVLTTYVVSAAYAFFCWKRDRDCGWISLFSLFAGLAVGTKLNGLFAVAPLGAFLLVEALYVGPERRSRITNCLRAVLPGFLALAPWLLLTWARTGNPLFPFLNKVFRSAAWYQDSNTAGADWAAFGVGTTWIHGLQLPWDLTFHGERFGEFGWYGSAGVALLGLPFGYFLAAAPQRRAMLALTAAILASLAAFLRISLYSRYLLPLFAFSAVVAALNCQAVWRLAARAPRARWLALALCAATGFGWLYFTRAVSLSELWYCMPERYPWRVALNQKSADEYLRGVLQEYEFMKFLDEKVAKKPVTYLGLGLGSACYSGDAVEYSRWHSMLGRKLIAEESVERFVEMLREHGLRYVAVNHNYLKYGDPTDPVKKAAIANQSFWTRYCEPVFGYKNIVMYYVHYDGVDLSGTQARSLLKNGDLKRTPEGALSDWGLAPGAKILPAGSNPDDEDATVLELTHEQMASQAVYIRPDTLYSLSADFWSPSKDQWCMLQLVWLDLTGKSIGNETHEWVVSDLPQSYELPRTSPPNAEAVAVFIRAKHEGGVVRMSHPKLIERRLSPLAAAHARIRVARRND